MDVEQTKPNITPDCYGNFYERRDIIYECVKCSIKEMCKFDSGAFNKKTGETFAQFKKRTERERKIKKIFSFFCTGAFVLLIFGIIGIVGYAGIKFVPSLISSVGSLIPERPAVSSPAPSKSPNEVATAESGSQTTASQAQADSGLRLRRLFWLAIGALLFLHLIIGGIGLLFYGFVRMLEAALFYFLLFIITKQFGTAIPPIGSAAFLIFVLIWPWIAPIVHPGLHRIPLIGGFFSIIDNIARSFRR